MPVTPATKARLKFSSRILFAFGLLLVTATYRPALAIDVEQTLWGFDGQIVVDRFTPLSVLLSNPTDQPVEVTLRLQKSGMGGGSKKLGAPIVEMVYLSPFASRWVQFYPYIVNQWDEWSLTWGNRADQRYPLKRPPPGNGATVALVDRDHLSSAKLPVKTFPENLFPTVVAATGNLQAVLLDHVPRWQKLRRDAFLNWIYQGGRVGLVPNQDGKYPEFGNKLSILNSPLQKQYLGNGTVIRLDGAADKTIKQFLNPLTDSKIRDEKSASSTDRSTPYQQSQQNWQLGPKVTFALQQMTYPHHNWSLIHLLSLSYLAILFPGWYLWSRRRVDFRITLGTFFLVALTYGAIFHTVGRRGYGESTCVNSVAIARPMTENTYDVIQWSNVFVTDGSAYKLSYGGGGHLYSTCQQFEQVHGVIDNGMDGYFMVDIPQFSSRNFAHHGTISQPHIDIEIAAFRADKGELKELELKVGESFPSDWLDAQVLYNNKIYRLTKQNENLQLVHVGRPVVEYLQASEELKTAYYASGRWNSRNKPSDPDRLYDQLLAPLIARALEIPGPDKAAQYHLSEDRLRLLLYTPATSPFFIENERLGRQGGCVLYVTDLLIPEKL